MRKDIMVKMLWNAVPGFLKPGLLKIRFIRRIGSSAITRRSLVRNQQRGRENFAVQDYEGVFRSSLDRIRQFVNNGERRLPVIINDLARVSWDASFLCHLYIGSHLENYLLANGVQKARIGSYPVKVLVINGKYSIVPSDTATRDCLIHFLRDILANRLEILSVVELGSGNGLNLFSLFYALPEHRRESVRFFACEPTVSGREAADRLAVLDRSMKIQGIPFNFYEPDFSFLAGLNDSVLFFTCHSVEQIPILPSNFFDKMLASVKTCSCVHFEPVGWQRSSDLVIARLNHDADLFEQVERDIPANLEGNRVSENAAWWSYIQDYNTNLLSLLASYGAAGKTVQKIALYDRVGENPFNPSSLILWETPYQAESEA